MTLNRATTRVGARLATCTIAACAAFSASAIAGTGPSSWVVTVDPTDSVLVVRGSDVTDLSSVRRVADRSDPSNLEAEALYGDAQVYLSLRAWSAAERILNTIITEHDGTPVAEQARADLKHLHENVFWPSRRSALGGPEAPTASEADATEKQDKVGPELAPWRWLLGERGIQDQFRMAVGDRLFFAAYSAALGTRNRATLEAQATWLSQHPDVQITIEAHSDEPGRSGDDVVIARERARVVREELIKSGIASQRINVVVYGRAKRVAVCESPACRAQNRRVVMRVERPTSIRAER